MSYQTDIRRGCELNCMHSVHLYSIYSVGRGVKPLPHFDPPLPRVSNNNKYAIRISQLAFFGLDEWIVPDNSCHVT